MPRLKIVKGGDAGKSIDLPRELVVGRDNGNDLKLQDATCSRHHARIATLDGRAVLTDLGSNNGTFVNGQKVREQLLQDGDQILIGRTLIAFEAGASTDRAMTVCVRDLDAASVEVRTSVAAEAPEPDPGLHLKRLYEIARLAGSTLDARALLEGLAAALLEALEADTAVGLLEDGSEPVVRRRGERAGQVVVSRAILERARANREALLVSCVPQDAGLKGRRSLVEEGVRSVVCAPITRGGRPLGVLYADARRPGREFGPGDLELLRAAAQLAASSLDNARAYERARDRAADLEASGGGARRVIAADPKMIEVLALVDRVAAADSTVLLLGESGTGKEVLARAIHERSARPGGPFVALNCAAIVETLLESELFGYEKGAFTGAHRARPGKFEAAEGGTLFLDEIGELSPGFQAKLLRVLEDRTFFRVGGTVPIRVDVRVVAATNRDLQKAIRDSAFREDLYYRLAVVTIVIPPLRERRDDLPLLAHHFLESVRRRTKKSVRAISQEALEALARYPWPGNVRELENVIERAVILADGDTLEEKALPAEIREPRAAQPEETPIRLEDAEKGCIRRALEKTGGKKGEASKLLGISWPTLNKKIREYGLQ